jgi:hypothetical protein
MAIDEANSIADESLSNEETICFFCEQSLIDSVHKLKWNNHMVHGDCFQEITCILSNLEWKKRTPSMRIPIYPLLSQKNADEISDEEFIEYHLSLVHQGRLIKTKDVGWLLQN